MNTSKAWAAASLAVVTLMAPAALAAEGDGGDAPNIGEIVSFVRWGGVLVSIGVIIGAIVIVRFMHGAMERLGARFSHLRLTFHKVESFARFFIYIVTGGAVVALSFQINQTVLTLVGGTLAVAVGFALRDLVAAMIAGFMIMLDRPFQVGDRVQYAGEYGDIIAIGLRSVRMQTLDDNTVTIPNNKVLTDVTSCANYGALDMQVVIEFFVGLEQDIALAERLITEGALSSRYIYLDKPVVVLAKQVIKENYVALSLKLKAYVLDTQYEKAFESDITKRVTRAFAEHGIQPPAVLHRTHPSSAREAARPRERPN